MPEVSMDYDAVDDLAEQVAGAAETLTGGRGTMIAAPSTYYNVSEEDSSLNINAFGNTPAASRLTVKYGNVRRAGSTATERLGEVLVEDADRLREVIACFQSTDHANADELCAVVGGNTLNVYSTHVHSGGSRMLNDSPPQTNPHPAVPWVPIDIFSNPEQEAIANDHVRAGQINTFEEIFNQNPGVVGADFNEQADKDNRSGEAVRGFEEEGHDIHAGRLEGDGTSASGRHIDYVVTAPGIDSGDPERVDGGPSDHQGQRVDITVSRW